MHITVPRHLFYCFLNRIKHYKTQQKKKEIIFSYQIETEISRSIEIGNSLCEKWVNKIDRNIFSHYMVQSMRSLHAWFVTFFFHCLIVMKLKLCMLTQTCGQQEESASPFSVSSSS